VQGHALRFTGLGEYKAGLHRKGRIKLAIARTFLTNVAIGALKRRITLRGTSMTELSQSTRVVILMCAFGLSNGCISSQDMVLSEPNDLNAEPEVVEQAAVKGQSITLESDVNWDVYSNRSQEQKAFLGKAQLVCANTTIPAGCPAGAVNYNLAGAWSARIDGCQGNARWIWAPGISAESTPAEASEYYFVNHVSLPGGPVSARIYLAVDDEAEVIVNGTSIGTIGSTTDYGVAWASQSEPTSLYITRALLAGQNTMTIRAANGVGTFAGCVDCTYQQHPAGVMFCIDVRY